MQQWERSTTAALRRAPRHSPTSLTPADRTRRPLDAPRRPRRWEAELEVPATGNWTFLFYRDDRARVTVNGTVVIDQLALSGAGVGIGPATPFEFEAGERVPLVVETVEVTGSARAMLYWRREEETAVPVPSSAYFITPASVEAYAVPASERSALREFYETLWAPAAVSGWSDFSASDGQEATFPCFWANIRCTIDSEPARVSQLLVGNQGLEGELPSSIASLTALTTLQLQTNTALTGTVPSFALLTSLDVSRTALSLTGMEAQPSAQTITANGVRNDDGGEFPTNLLNSDTLTSLSLYDAALTHLASESWTGRSLTTLDISNNQLQELPGGFFAQLPALTSLGISANGRLRDLPPLELPELTSLDLSMCDLHSLPDVINAPKVTSLNLADNHDLTTLPASIDGFSSLTYFDAPNGQLLELPEQLFTLPSLVRVNANNNNLTALPANVGDAPGLAQLYLTDNLISELPEEFWNMEVQVLDLDRNFLSELGPSIHRAGRLQDLRVRSQRDGGLQALHTDFCNVTTLYYAYFENNALVELPDCFEWMAELRQVWVTNNQLESIPPSLVRAPWLQHFRARGNRIANPEVLQQCQRCHTLDFGDNQLFGVFPSGWGSMTSSIRHLWFDRNFYYSDWSDYPWNATAESRSQFRPLPDDIGMLPSYVRIQLHENMLAGDLRETAPASSVQVWLHRNPFDCNVQRNGYPNKGACSGCVVTPCVTHRIYKVFPTVADEADEALIDFSEPVLIPTLASTQLTIIGEGFKANMRCEFRGIYTSTILVSDTRIRCRTPANEGLLGDIMVRVQDTSVTDNWVIDGRTTAVGRHSNPSPPLTFLEGCPPGTFYTPDGSTLCTPCEPGFATGDFDSEECQMCEPGTASGGERSTSCDECEPGMYAPNPGSRQCILCPPGTFGTQWGAASCDLCPPGTQAPVSTVAVTTCEPCPRGTASNVSGAVTCPPCDTASFTGDLGARKCIKCPDQTRSSVKSATVVEDCLCIEGYYGGKGGPCYPCPDGGYCAGMTDGPPVALEGFWVSDDDPFTFFQCTPPEACLGKTPAGNATCAPGYTGRLCGKCEPLKYFRLGDRCQKCPDNAGWLWAALIMTGLGGCFVLLATARPGPTKIFSPGIGLAFVQLVSLYHGFSVNWPNLVLGAFDAASLTNLNIELFSPECSVELTYWSKWFFKMMVPVMVVGTFALYYALLPCADTTSRMARASWRWMKQKPCCSKMLQFGRVAKTACRLQKELVVARSRQGCADCKLKVRRTCKERTDRLCAPVRNVCGRVTDWLEESLLEPIRAARRRCFGVRDGPKRDALGADNMFAIRDALSATVELKTPAKRRGTLATSSNPLHNRPDLVHHLATTGADSKQSPTAQVAATNFDDLPWEDNPLSKGKKKKAKGASRLAAARALGGGSGRLRGILQRAAKKAGSTAVAEKELKGRMSDDGKPASAKKKATGMALVAALAAASNTAPSVEPTRGRRMTVAQLWQASKEAEEHRDRGQRGGGRGRGAARGGRRGGGAGAEGRTAAVRTRLASASTAQLEALEVIASGKARRDGRGSSTGDSRVVTRVGRDGKVKRMRKKRRPKPIEVDGDAPGAAPPSPSPPGKKLNAALSKRGGGTRARATSQAPGRVLNAATSTRLALGATERGAAAPGSRVGAIKDADQADLRRFRRRRSSRKLDMDSMRDEFSGPGSPSSPRSTGSFRSLTAESVDSTHSSGGVDVEDANPDPTPVDVNQAIIAKRQLRVVSKLPLLPRSVSEKALMRQLVITSDIRDRFMYAATSVGSIGYTFLASTAVEPLNCLEQPDGSFTLKAAGDVVCYDEEWMKYIVLIIGFSLLYALGIPLFFFKVLAFARRYGQLGTSAFEARYGVLTLPYTTRCWWWELANILRKLLVIVALKFAATDQSAGSILFQVVLAMLVFSGYTAVLGLMTPYEFHQNNRLALITTIASLFSLFAGVLYFSERLTEAGEDFLSVLVVIGIVAAMGLVLMTMAMEKRRAAENVVLRKAIGLNRYQLRAMEERLMRRLFPRCGSLLSRSLDQWPDDERDAFLRDIQAVLRLVPDQGMELLHGRRAAAQPAGGHPLFGVRKSRDASVEARKLRKQREASETAELEWTGNKVEMVRYSTNPVVEARRRQAQRDAQSREHVSQLGSAPNARTRALMKRTGGGTGHV